jgi:hypothetical protein
MSDILSLLSLYALVSAVGAARCGALLGVVLRTDRELNC